MKKYVLLGVIALVMLLSVPAAMAADITVSGPVEQPAIGVSILGTQTPAFTQLITGAACNPVTPADGMPSVQAVVTGAGVTSWAVTASSPTPGWGILPGDMYQSADHSKVLADYFQLGSSAKPYRYMNTVWPDFMTSTDPLKTTTGTFADSLYMKQCISGLDQNGVYTIAVSFTGMVTGTA
jgi:hypothetical protein